MKNIQKNNFWDYLDIVQVINQAAREELGEDSIYCVASEYSALVSVYDGCGGLGARKYEAFQGHSGAYMASRIVSGAIRDWYQCNYQKKWNNAKQLMESINEYIYKAYSLCESYGTERIKIRGSMVRKFPTTMALAYAERDKDGVLVHILWAGDSRIYLLDEKGLAQLSKDDTDVEDALENLMSDGVMTNVLSSDGDYNINCKSIRLTNPAIIFSATDGCFGYIPSPMEFEYVILNSLVHSKTPEDFKKKLHLSLAQYAGDDLALGLMSFFYGDFDNTKKSYMSRLKYIENEYIKVLNCEKTDECTQRLWLDYKSMYERYLY